MSHYEQILLDTTRTQTEYINELEEMCKDCERIVLHAGIAKIAFKEHKFMIKYFLRRGFRLVELDIRSKTYIFGHDQNLQ